MSLVVDTDDALGAHRPAVASGKPAAGLLDPLHLRRGRGSHAIFDPVGRTLAALRGGRRDESICSNRTLWLDQAREFPGGSEPLKRDIRKHGGDVLAPDQPVGRDIPEKGSLAEGGKDLIGRGKTF